MSEEESLVTAFKRYLVYSSIGSMTKVLKQKYFMKNHVVPY